MKTSLLRSLVLTLILPFSLARAAQHLGFDEWNLNWGNNSSIELPGRLYVPTNYNPNQKYPLVIFMHGLGERGTNNTAPLDSVADSLVPKIKARGYFMYAAQIPNGSVWEEAKVGESMRQAVFAMASYNIDPTRIYVTGLSLGGGGAKNSMKIYTRALAASIPVCGTWDSDLSYVSALLGKPIWAFHGELDGPDVPVGASRSYITSIINAGQNQGQNPPPFSVSYPNNNYYSYNWNNVLKYTEFKGANHFIWGRVYSENDNLGLYDWMAAQATDISAASLRLGETAYFDVGYFQNGVVNGVATDTQGRKWNVMQGYTGLSSMTGLFPFALNSAGVSTSVCVSAVKGFSSLLDANSCYSRPGYDDNMAKDGWVTPVGTSEANPVIWKIHGLVPGAVYTMDAYASHVPLSSENRRWTRYRYDSVISGTTVTQFGDLDADGNTTGASVSLNVTAGDDGAVLLKVFPAPGKGSPFAQLNTLAITRSGTTAPSNQAPIVNAGPDQTVTLYDGVTLSGTASDDGLPTGSTLSTQWTKDSGPGTVTFVSGTALSTTASFSDPGTYVLRLTASDSALSSFDTVTVIVNEWKNIEIGTVPVAGTGVVTSGTAVVTGSGPNIWQNNDDFHFMFRPVSGDCTIIARMVSHPYQHWASKAGIMLRGTLTRDASHVFLGMQPGGVESLYMEHPLGQSWSGAAHSIGTVPYWLKIVRVGNALTSSISPDGQVWVEVGTCTLPLGQTAYVGFAIASATSYTLTAVYDNITVVP